MPANKKLSDLDGLTENECCGLWVALKSGIDDDVFVCRPERPFADEARTVS
jgi:hypothetical protein